MASPPGGSPRQYSPALRRVTTGFGMGPGGADALSTTGTPHPPPPRVRSRTPGAGGEPRSVTRLLLCHAGRDHIVPSEGSSPPTARPPRWKVPHLRSFTTNPWIALFTRDAPHRHSLETGSNWGNRPRPSARLGSGRLPAVHPPPVDPVVSRGPYLTSEWGGSSWGGVPA